MSLLTSLLAGYKFEEATAAATWVDVLGANNLTATGTITSAAGVIGQAAGGFAAATNYLTLAAAMAGATPYSVSLWFYLTSTAATQVFWAQLASGSLSQWVQFQVSRGAGSLTFQATGGVGPSYAVTPAANTWHHLAATHDGTTAKLYYDGVYRATAAPAFGSAPTSTVVGAGAAGASPCSGRIDSLYVWGKTLTDGGASLNAAAGGEVAQLYNGGLGLDWPFNRRRRVLTCGGR